MSTSARETTSTGWQRRPFLSAAMRAGVTLVPMSVSAATALLLNRELPWADTAIGTVGRALGIFACSMGALVLSDMLARKFLPLAALLQLSLVFPDRTPSRFRTALKGGSGRRLARQVALARKDGISDDPSRGAEQLLLLATAIGDHDRRTRGHSERVRLYTDLIAEELHLSKAERSKLQWASLIHDVGKVTVPGAILNKKGPPDDREWEILKRHPLAGEELVAPVAGWLGEAVHAVGGHHERWDGTGYPRGLDGSDIPRSAAIVAVADAFEVMTAVRSYKKAMSLADARAELTRCAGNHFSPEVVRALLNVSLGKLRRSMGVFASMAHVPFLGQVSKAVAYTPDTVSTAVGFTTTTASAGAGVLALSSGLALASPSATPAPSPTPTSVQTAAANPSVSLSPVRASSTPTAAVTTPTQRAAPTPVTQDVVASTTTSVAAIPTSTDAPLDPGFVATAESSDQQRPPQSSPATPGDLPNAPPPTASPVALSVPAPPSPAFQATPPEPGHGRPPAAGNDKADKDKADKEKANKEKADEEKADKEKADKGH